MKTQNIVIFVVVLVILIVGISFLSKGERSPNTTATSAESTQVAPHFSLQDLNGNTVTLADYKGVKPVVLDFWATWCPNCQRDMPRLNGYYEKYNDQVEVIGVNLQENKSLVEKFVQQKGLTFPIVLDPTGLASRSYSVRYTNYHVLIDKDGNIVKTIPGDISESDIQSLIN